MHWDNRTPTFYEYSFYEFLFVFFNKIIYHILLKSSIHLHVEWRYSRHADQRECLAIATIASEAILAYSTLNAEVLQRRSVFTDITTMGMALDLWYPGLRSPGPRSPVPGLRTPGLSGCVIYSFTSSQSPSSSSIKNIKFLIVQHDIWSSRWLRGDCSGHYKVIVNRMDAYWPKDGRDLIEGGSRLFHTLAATTWMNDHQSGGVICCLRKVQRWWRYKSIVINIQLDLFIIYSIFSFDPQTTLCTFNRQNVNFDLMDAGVFNGWGWKRWWDCQLWTWKGGMASVSLQTFLVDVMITITITISSQGTWSSAVRLGTMGSDCSVRYFDEQPLSMGTFLVKYMC